MRVEAGLSTTNVDQRAYWAREGHHWVHEAHRYDAMNRLFGEALFERVNLQPGERVLDVGCGTGATTLDAAYRVAPDGTVIGVDVSSPMLELARRRVSAAGYENATLIEADAQVYPFDEGSFDAVISRFGVMFFEDPEAAFANFSRALRPGGRLAMVCWQDMFHSEWIIVPGSAAAAHVGLPDFGPPGTPGPFAFADAERVRLLLAGSGLSDITIDEITRPMHVGDDPEDVIAFIKSIELVRDHLFADKPDHSVAAAVEAAREAIVPYATADGVVMSGGAWLVSARC